MHANLVLSRYQTAARFRLAEIEGQGEVGVDTRLEKGLLLQKVLHENYPALEVLRSALQLPGGTSNLLYLAGVSTSVNKHYQEAVEFFDRALATAEDQALVKLLKKKSG